MKHFLLFLVTVIAFLTTSLVSASAGVFACTMEYAPVCAKVQVQCIRAPCYPVYETFSNMCVMSQNSSAVFAHSGECKASETGVPAVLSERLKNSLTQQYNAFVTRISLSEIADQIAKLKIVDTRITNRLAALSINTLPLTLEQEMVTDRLKYALLFIQNLVQTDISYLTDEVNGMHYVSRDSNQCSNIKFYCLTTQTPFFTDKGCGCKE